MTRPEPGSLRARGAASEAAWEFARLEEFWAGFRPLTPWGKDLRAARTALSDRAAIEAELDLTEAWLAFAERAGGGGEAVAPRLDRVAHHLGRMPRLPEPEGRSLLDLVEIFSVKKFLHNYRALRGLLDEEALEAFGFSFESGELAALLELGGAGGESFNVADAYDPMLPALRAGIAAVGDRLEALRAEREERIAARTGIRLAGRDFVLVAPGEGGPALLAACEEDFDIEPWDGLSHVLRPKADAEELEVLDERELLLAREREAEARVVARISRAIVAEGERLADYAAALRRLDLARARAAALGGTAAARPRFEDSKDAALCVTDGRFLPLEASCAALGVRYTPVNLDLGERVALLFGSNMGGKTVALESLLFFQILAQCGFHVPAAAFTTRVYPLIHYVGEGSGDAKAALRGGLSGFGREMGSYMEAMEAAGGGALLAFDEFARTTRSDEAEALLSAIVERSASAPGMKCLFSTHFRGVAAAAGVRRLRMRGLDREAASRQSAAPGAMAGMAERMNALMRYEITEDEATDPGSDAIAVAGLLGLDPALVERAREFHMLSREAREGERR